MSSKRLDFRLDNIQCTSCIPVLKSALENIVSPDKIKIDFSRRLLSITTEVNPESVINSVNLAGYKAELLKHHEQSFENSQNIYRKLLQKAIIAGSFGFLLLLLELYNFLPSLFTETGQMTRILIGLGTFLLMYFTGSHIYYSAWRAFFHHYAVMDSLIAIGSSAAWVYSMVVTLWPEYFANSNGQVFFDTSLMILAFVNFGAALEVKAHGNTSAAAEKLYNLRAKTARRIKGEEEEEVSIEEVKIGDILHSFSGETIALDGEVLSGEASIDESIFTGEGHPVSKRKDEEVIGGTVIQAGNLLYKVTRIGEDTALSHMVALIQNAQHDKPHIARLTDRISAIFVPSVLIISILTSLLWYNLGYPLSFIVTTALTVLVITCPCSLGIAAPISMTMGIGKAAQYGILIRHGEAIRNASRLTTIVLDKTGTITESDPIVTNIISFSHLTEDKILQIAASIEKGSPHPLAHAILQEAEEKSLPLLLIKHREEIISYGITALVNEEKILCGNARLMKANNINIEKARDKIEEVSRLGKTPIYLAREKELLGIIVVTNPIREDSKKSIQELIKYGLEVIMLTGDNEIAALAVAKQVGIHKVIAEVLPEDKANEIEKLQQAGKIVAMVGDGVNDAPALMQANVGFAISSGAYIANESADITLLRNSIHGVINAILISKATRRNLKQNLWGAFIYNSCSVPVAAGILYPFYGILLNPMIAAAIMALSSFTVISNANRLRFWKIKNVS